MNRGIPLNHGDDEYEEFKNKIGYEIEDGRTLYRPINAEDIKEITAEGKQVVISAQNFTLYYPEDVDGNGKYDDVYDFNIGGHAMSAVGTTDDGKIIVSSWGKEFLLDPKKMELMILLFIIMAILIL